MKTILFAAMAAAATLAPLQAAKIKPKPYIVQNIVLATTNGKISPGMPVFKKGQTVDLKITGKLLTGPQKIALPNTSKSVTADTYYRYNGVANTDEATVRKNTSTKKVIAVELNYTRPPSLNGGGLVTYILVPKK